MLLCSLFFDVPFLPCAQNVLLYFHLGIAGFLPVSFSMHVLMLTSLLLVWQDARKLEQLYCDPSQRLVAECLLMDLDTAVVSDRKGSIAVLSCADHLEGTRLLISKVIRLGCVSP